MDVLVTRFSLIDCQAVLGASVYPGALRHGSHNGKQRGVSHNKKARLSTALDLTYDAE